MASTINSDNGLVSGSMGLKYSADATGNLVLQTAGNTVVTLDTGLNANFTGTVSAVGNVTGSNIRTAGLITATGNVQSGNVLTAGIMSSTGNVQGGNILTSGAVSATGSINALNTFGFENRIINGGMTIDQRNAGASITPIDTQYLTDRWVYRAAQAGKYTAQQNAGSVTPPVGFTNYLGLTSTSAFTPATTDYFQLRQIIEGFNIADLGWGTANAKTVTLSFWVRSSLTGQFGGAIRNNPAFTYTYPFTFTISSANTWTQVSITIVGPNASQGVWNTNNTQGIEVVFDLGCGSTFLASSGGSWQAGGFAGVTGDVKVVSTNGATFYLTGVQFEVGTQATSWDFRDYGRELILCQRYFQISPSTQGCTSTVNETQFLCAVPLWTPMRTSPTATLNGSPSIHKPGIAFITINSVDSAPSSTGGSYTTLTIASGAGTGVSGQAISPLKLSAELQ